MKRGIRDFDFSNKTVILRCDLNVSIKNNKIIDDTRIKESLKTIEYILKKKGKLIILSHFGKVKKEEDKKTYSLKIVYERLNELLPNKIKFVPYTKDDLIKKELDNISYGHGILLENTRFEDLNGMLESNCDMSLASYWASLGDIFINDAFGTIHRKHASNYGISKFLPSGIGFLIEKEMKALDKLDNPKRPFAILMGGSKVKDKIEIIEELLKKCDYLILGGKICFTFLKASRIDVNDSLVEFDMIEKCKSLLIEYADKIMLPIDFYGVLDNQNVKVLYHIMDMPKNFIGFDIGPKTVDLYKMQLEGVKTLFWNGPFGMYEDENYIFGTEEIMKYLKHIKRTIVGGGDIVSCVNKFNLKNIYYVSTGGGATLCYLVNKNLPGLVNIEEK